MAPSTANDRQVGGSHYKRKGRMQHWDMVSEFELDYFQAQITRYLFRWRQKHGLEDLRKAQHYLEKYLEVAAREIAARETTAASPTGRGYVNQDQGSSGVVGGGLDTAPKPEHPTADEMKEAINKFWYDFGQKDPEAIHRVYMLLFLPVMHR